MVIIQDAVISFIEKIKSATRLHKLIAFAAVAVVLMFVSYVASGVRVTYNVHVDGKTVANVASHSVYEEGVKAAGKLLNGDKDSIGNTELKAVITVNAKSASAKEVGALIIKNAASVCDGYKVTIGEDDALTVDCNITVAYGQSVVSVAGAVQAAVTNALESMAGVKIAAVNVNVCGIIRQ